MSNLIQQFASTQSQSQLGLASQAFGLNSASKSSPYLSGATTDSKSLSCCTSQGSLVFSLELLPAASALGSAMNKLSSVFSGASSGGSLIGNLVRAPCSQMLQQLASLANGRLCQLCFCMTLHGIAAEPHDNPSDCGRGFDHQP